MELLVQAVIQVVVHLFSRLLGLVVQHISRRRRAPVAVVELLQHLLFLIPLAAVVFPQPLHPIHSGIPRLRLPIMTLLVNLPHRILLVDLQPLLPQTLLVSSREEWGTGCKIILVHRRPTPSECPLLEAITTAILLLLGLQARHRIHLARRLVMQVGRPLLDNRQITPRPLVVGVPQGHQHPLGNQQVTPHLLVVQQHKVSHRPLVSQQAIHHRLAVVVPERQRPLVNQREIPHRLAVRLHKENRLPLANLLVTLHLSVVGAQVHHLPLANKSVTLRLLAGAATLLEVPLLEEVLVVINKVAVVMAVLEMVAVGAPSHHVASSRRANASTATTVGFRTACKAMSDNTRVIRNPMILKS